MTVLFAVWLGGGLIAVVVAATRDLRLAIACSLLVMSLVPEVVPFAIVEQDGLVGTLLFTTVLLACFLGLVRGHTRIALHLISPGLLLLFFIGLLVMAYALEATNADYAIDKARQLLLWSMVPIVALAALGPFTAREIRVLLVALVWGSISATLALITFGDLTAARSTLGAESPITYARAIGIGASVLVAWLIAGERKGTLTGRALALVPMLVLLGGVAATGSRGPLVAVAVAGLFAFMTSVLAGRAKTSVVGMVMVVGVAVAASSFSGASAERLAGLERVDAYLLQAGDNSSDLARLGYWDVALDGIRSSAGMGIGTGDFAGLVSMSGRAYPHNVALELWLEQGWLAIGAFMTLLVLTLRRALQLARVNELSVVSVVLSGLFAFALTNALVSGDVATNRQLWIVTGLLWLTVPGKVVPDRPREGAEALRR